VSKSSEFLGRFKSGFNARFSRVVAMGLLVAIVVASAVVSGVNPTQVYTGCMLTQNAGGFPAGFIFYTQAGSTPVNPCPGSVSVEVSFNADVDTTLDQAGIEAFGFVTGPHTVDTNAGTICAPGEYLDGDETCYSFDDGDWTIAGNDMYSGVSGHVGIGTSSPDEELVVGTPLGSGWGFTAMTVGDPIGAGVEVGTPTYSLSIDSSSTFGRTRIISSDDGGLGLGDVEFWVGNVGIGTGTPSARLDVVGDTEINGDLQADSFSYITPKAGKIFADPAHCVALSGADSDSTFHARFPGNQSGLGNSFGPAIDLVTDVDGNRYYYCPITLQIPPEATFTLTGARMAYRDQETTCLLGANIYNKSFGTFSPGSLIGSVYSGDNSTDYSHTGGPTAKDFPAFSHTVTENDIVWVEAIFGNSGGGGICYWGGVQLDYSVDRP
jgi:hypothetical protein